MEIIDFFKWLFHLRLDAVIVPWIEGNKITLGIILGAPYMLVRWFLGNLQKIREAEREYHSNTYKKSKILQTLRGINGKEK